jgi:phosphotransferase system HPr (HPr) family protein
LSIRSVKRSQVVVPWEEGLHLRPAARLVRLAYTFRSSISLRSGQRAANLRSILSVVTLCAAIGTPLEVQATGDDEQEAVAAISQVFELDQAIEATADPPSRDPS